MESESWAVHTQTSGTLPFNLVEGTTKDKTEYRNPEEKRNKDKN